jgi:hypothetical protein
MMAPPQQAPVMMQHSSHQRALQSQTIKHSSGASLNACGWFIILLALGCLGGGGYLLYKGCVLWIRTYTHAHTHTPFFFAASCGSFLLTQILCSPQRRQIQEREGGGVLSERVWRSACGLLQRRP